MEKLIKNIIRKHLDIFEIDHIDFQLSNIAEVITDDIIIVLKQKYKVKE